MDIEVKNLGKRFNYHWLYRNLNLSFSNTHKYAIKGPNGSGKSTLLKLISSYLTPSEGIINYRKNSVNISSSDIYQHVSFVAPYLELIEEYTFSELFDFHSHFRLLSISKSNLESLLDLGNIKNKSIRHFSSGMKQRTKLALGLATNSSIYLLDEPTTNLDNQGKQWYEEMIVKFCKDALVIIASNESDDFVLCDEVIDIEELRKQI